MLAACAHGQQSRPGQPLLAAMLLLIKARSTSCCCRTGKKYEIEISDHGTIKGSDLKQITAGGDNVGLRPYDPG